MTEENERTKHRALLNLNCQRGRICGAVDCYSTRISTLTGAVRTRATHQALQQWTNVVLPSQSG